MNDQTWRPSRTLAFVVNQPKAREIHAADFSDRVVHHWLVPRLEAWFETVFIHDSYSNRKGKGTHAAVDRLQDFVRQATRNGKVKAHYLQLDIANFFNSIDRGILYGLIRHRAEKVWQTEKRIAAKAAPTNPAPAIPASHLPRIVAALRRAGRAYVIVREEGYLKRGLKRRILSEIGGTASWMSRAANPNI